MKSDGTEDAARSHATAEEVNSPLTITFHQEERSLRLEFSGELDLYTVPQMEQALESAYNLTPAVLVFDFHDLEFIDSAGLALLIDVQRRINDDNALTLLVAAEGQVRLVLELSRFDRFFDIKYAKQGELA